MADYGFSNYGGQSMDPSIESPDYGWGQAPQQQTSPYDNPSSYLGDGSGDYWSNPFPSSAISDYASNPTYAQSAVENNIGQGGVDSYFNPDEEEDRKTRTPGMTMGLGPKTPGFWDSGFGKLMRGVTSLHPVGKLGWAAADLVNGRNPLAVGAGMLPGLPGMFARGALDYSKNGNMGAAVGTQAGGVLGGMLGNAVSPGLGVVTGPLGANIGREVGGAPGTPGQSQGNSNTFDVNSILSGLSGLYSSNQANKALGANQDAISGQISSLSGMYGPDSPYAKQLRQTLERQDAKAGRNSQYGPREAQLQALLAEKAAGAASTVGNLAGQSQKLNDQRTMQRNQQLGILLGMGQRSGLFNGLRGMFNQSQAPQAEAPFIDYGEYV